MTTTAAKAVPATRFRSDIHGLRAVAVALVVLYHAGVPWLPGGYVGVDVFFVISGCLITGLLLDELDRTGRVSLRQFWARRIRRLLPASALVLVVTVAAARLLLPPLQSTGVAHDGIATAVYLANVWFGWTGIEYLSDPAPSPLLHYWSLAVEEQFYLFWPVLLLLAALAWRRRPSAAVAASTVVVGVASFALCVLLTPVSQPMAFFGLPTRAWEFAVGGMVAIALRRGLRLPAPFAAGLAWLGLLLLVAVAVVFDDGTAFPGWRAAVPVLATALVIGAGPAAGGRGPERVLGLAPLQRLGSWSYSLYLWHWPLLVLPAAAWGVPLPGWARAGLMLVAVALAALTFSQVEVRFRHLPVLVAAPRRSYGFGLATTAVAVAVALGSGAPERLDTGRPAQDVAAVTSETVPQFVPSNLEPSLLEADEDLPPIYDDGCHASLTDVEATGCWRGDPEATRTMVLFGDSHAAQWYPAFVQIAEDEGWRILTLTKSSCPSASIAVVQENLERAYWECEEWRGSAFDRIEELSPDVVVLANHRDQILASGQPAGTRDWVAGLDETFDVLPDESRVVLMGDTPQFPESPPVCLSGALENPSDCGEDRSLAAPDAHAAMERKAAAAAGATYVDTREWACPGETCQVIVGNTLMYRDGHHLTTRYAESLVPSILDSLGAELR